MDAEVFDHLVDLVTPMIKKNDTNFRDSISAGERLAVTLHYLSTGNSFRSLQYLFRIPQTTISKIIPEVLDAIWTVLKDQYVRVSFSICDDVVICYSINVIRHFFSFVRHRHQRKNGNRFLNPLCSGTFHIALVPSMGNML